MSVEVGHLYHYPGFKLSSGVVKDKYLMVVAKDDFNILVVTCTSKQWSRERSVGCINVGSRWHSWHLPQPSFACLSKPTWLCLAEVYEMGLTSFRAGMLSGLCKYKGASISKNLLDCLLLNVNDISANHVAMIQASYNALPASPVGSYV